MTSLRKKLQDKLRRKYKWHTVGGASSDYTGYLYKSIDGAWVAKHPELGRATNTIDVDLGSVLGDIYLTLSEEFPQVDDTSHDRTIGITLTFEEFESLYLITKEVYEKRKGLKERNK